MAKLTVKKEHLESVVHCDYNNSSMAVTLKSATQEQLKIVQELGLDVFETPEKEVKTK
jgi:hypothetical protein